GSIDGVGVKSVDRSVFCRDIENVPFLPADGDLRKVQRLRVDFAIHHEFTELSKFHGVHVRGSQYRFIQVLAGAAVVVVIGDDVHSRGHWSRADGQRRRIAGHASGTIGDHDTEHRSAVGGGGGGSRVAR